MVPETAVGECAVMEDSDGDGFGLIVVLTPSLEASEAATGIDQLGALVLEERAPPCLPQPGACSVNIAPPHQLSAIRRGDKIGING